MDVNVQLHITLKKCLSVLCTAVVLSACSNGPESSSQLATQGLLSGALSLDGENAVIGSIHHGGSLWDLSNNEKLYAWNHAKGELSSIRATSFSRNGKLAVTCVEDAMVLWNTQSGKAMQFWQASDRILSIKLNRDGSRALMGLRNGTVTYFDMNRGASIYDFNHQAEVRIVDLSEDGSIGLTGSDDKTAKVLDLNNGKEIRSLKLNNFIKTAALSPSGTLAFTTSQREDALVWDTKTGEVKFRLANRYTNYTTSTFSDDESFLSAGTFQGEIKRWNISTGEETNIWQAKARKEFGGASSKAIVAIADVNANILALTSDGLMQTFKY